MVKKVYDTTLTVTGLGKLKIRFTLAMAKGSLAVFSLGKDVAKYSGLSAEDAKKYGDSPDSAYIFGLCNVMNGGDDVYYYTNATRMQGRMDKIGVEAALLERNTYELGHLTFLMLAMNLVKSADWVSGRWPTVGDGADVSEEQYVELLGKLGELIGQDYMKMYYRVIG